MELLQAEIIYLKLSGRQVSDNLESILCPQCFSWPEEEALLPPERSLPEPLEAGVLLALAVFEKLSEPEEEPAE